MALSGRYWDNNMNPTPSWKTSLLGILAVLFSVGSIWVPAKYQPQLQQTSVLLLGGGLVAAKDHSNQ